VLVAAAEVGINYAPALLQDVEPPGLLVVRGPRRVGKSVSCKRLVARLCEREDLTPWQVIYLSVDGFRSQDLRRAFVLGRELTAPAGEGRRFWIVDEVTAVEGWVPLVKELRDNTELAFDAVVLTGSSARDLAEARRSLGAGRTGVADPFRILLPMTFREFLTVSSVPVPQPPMILPDALTSESTRDVVASLEPFIDDLDLAWQRFLESGGFPRAVGETLHRGDISPEFVFDLLSWLTGDVDPDGPPDSVVRLLQELHRRTAAPLNLRNTAETLNTTRERLGTRLNRLVDTFGAFWCPKLGEDGLPAPNSQSKLYLIDPLIARLPHLRDPSSRATDMTCLAEGQLALELARSIDRLAPGRFVEQRAVLYARTSTGNEVDFAPVPIIVSGAQSATTPLEAKWVSRKWRREALVMRGRYGNGVLATKDIVDLTDDVWAVPAPIIALLLN
jgi:predicted AAA+ superfamily ATPase